jgi:antitoxin VapB
MVESWLECTVEVIMAVNIKNDHVEKLLDEVVRLTGESKTEAVRRALEERRQRLVLRVGGPEDGVRLLAFLEDEFWPQIPAELIGTHLSKHQEEEILGYGESGV